MKSDATEQFLSRRILWQNRAKWALWTVAVFCFGAAIVAFTQGRDLASRADSLADYGSFFWNGPNPNAEYSGIHVLAEERYNTAFLWVCSGVVAIGLGFLAVREKRINERLLASQDNAKAEDSVAPHTAGHES